MRTLFQLLPGEHITAFPARFYHLGLLDQVKSCEYLGVSRGIYDAKPQHLLCTAQHKAISIFDINNYQQLWMDHGFGKLINKFLNKEEKLLIQNSLSNLHSKCVTGQLSIENDSWNWCHLCTAEDRETFGVSYYHRDHQIPGVFHCAKHQIRLTSNCLICGFRVLNLAKSPLPPTSNECPSCNSNMPSNEVYYDETMDVIESKMIQMTNQYCSFQLYDFTKHIRNFIGIDITTPLDIYERKRLTEWKRFIRSFLTSQASDTYFKKSKGKTSKNRSEYLLTRSRLYNESSTVGITHPLIHLIALKATKHEIFS